MHEPIRLAVLLLIAVNHSEWVTRRYVCSKLWPDIPPHRGLNRLRQAIHRLRSLLGRETILTHGNGDLEVNRRALNVDTVCFHKHRTAGRHAEAAALYAGPFLDGFSLPGRREFDDWVEGWRLCLQEGAVKSLRTLAETAERAGRHQDALELWERGAAISWLDEHALRGRLRCLIRAADRGAAVRLYRKAARDYHRELGVDLSPETRGLMDELK